MSIQHQVLGVPGRDNALYVEIDTGQAIHRLLFDCGDACLNELSISQIQAIDGLFFSHFHVDHVAGFDMFLRCNYCRDGGPVEIWGPRGASETIHHRLRGVTWNLVSDLPGEFRVHEIDVDHVSTHGFLTCEGFATAHPQDGTRFDRTIVDHADFRVEAVLLDHGVPSVAYIVQESDRTNVDTSVLANLGLRPGPWLKAVKDLTVEDAEEVAIEGQPYSVGDLRKQLLRTVPGESIAYLTDFRLDPESEERLVAMLEGCQVIVCENNFRNEDRELAERSFHMVSDDVSRLACRVAAERLVLFHLSDRYTREQWRAQLEEVRAGFANTEFPEHWQLGGL